MIEWPIISVRNCQRAVKVDAAKLAESARKAVPFCLRLKRSRETELARLREIAVLLVSDRRMTELHRQFLGKNGPTDVLTFQHGEIVVSVETAIGNARRFKTSASREVLLYIVHGLLHLHGFDDTTAAEAKRMDAAQNRIMSMVCGAKV